MCFGQGATGEHVCGGKAGGFLDTVEEEDLIGRGDEKDTLGGLAHE